MQERLFALRRTEQSPRTSGCRFPVDPYNCGTTYRASLRHDKTIIGIPLPGLGDPDNLGNNIAGPSHYNPVSPPDFFASDFIFVVQGRICHRDAPDEYGLEARNGGQRSGAPDLDIDAVYFRNRFFGGKFVGNGKARRAGQKPQLILEG
jgi:hypothetical protein